MVVLFGSMYPVQTFFSWWPWREGHTCSHSEHRSQDSQRRWYCLTWGRESSTLPGIFYRSDLRKQVGSFFAPGWRAALRGFGGRLRLLVELLERLSACRFPRGQSICASTVDDNCSGGWTGELHIFDKDKEPAFFDQCAVGDEFFSPGQDMGMVFRCGALFQDGRGSFEDDKSICGSLPSSFGPFVSADQNAARLVLSGPLGNGRKNVGAQNGKELADASQKDLHVFAVRLGKPGSARLVLLERRAIRLGGLGDQAAFKMSHMRLGDVFVFADKYNGGNPKFLCFALFQSFADDFRFADIGARCARDRVASARDIDSGFVEFVARKKLIQFGARRGNGFSLQLEISAVRRFWRRRAVEKA